MDMRDLHAFCVQLLHVRVFRMSNFACPIFACLCCRGSGLCLDIEALRALGTLFKNILDQYMLGSNLLEVIPCGNINQTATKEEYISDIGSKCGILKLLGLSLAPCTELFKVTIVLPSSSILARVK